MNKKTIKQRKELETLLNGGFLKIEFFTDFSGNVLHDTNDDLKYDYVFEGIIAN